MTEPFEPVERPSAGSKLRRWSPLALALLVCMLFALSFTGSRSGSGAISGSAAEMSVDNLLLARQAFLDLHSPARRSPRREALRSRLVAGHLRASRIDPSPASIRRLALSLYMANDGRWREAVQRLATAPVRSSVAHYTREMALWESVLGGEPSAARIAELEAAVPRMNLGWYAHIALEAAYRNGGQAEKAAEEVRRANRSSARVFVLGMLAGAAGLVGLGILIMLAARTFLSRRSYRPPLTKFDRLLAPRAPWPYTPSQRTVLYYLFLSYLASMALFRAAVSLLGIAPYFEEMARRGPAQLILLSSTLTLFPLIAPAVLYATYGRRAFIPLRALGFCTSSWKMDLVFGAAGYMASVPLLYLSRVLSERLFHGVETPLNPAITAFATSQNGLYQAIVFLQAALMAPLIEETLFRGVFFQSLEARMGRIASALVASGIFAVLHPQLPLGFLGIFVLGLVFNSLFILRRSLLPAVFAHAINNGLILLFLLLLIRS